LKKQMIIPPYAGVKMVEYHDRITLKPVAAFREVVSLCKINGGDKDFEPWDGMHPMMIQLQKQGDIWLIIQWHIFEDGTEEVINLRSIAEATEVEVRERFDGFVRFLMMSKEKLRKLEKCFVVPEEERNYIADRFPEMPPDPSATDDYDLYQARLKVLAGMQPKTVSLIEEAYAADNPVQRENAEFEAVSAYYAEMAHYWNSEAVKAWQRSNPIAAEWIKEFARVFQKPRKELDAIDHEIVLNWLRRGYNFLTAEELSDAVFQATGKQMTPEALKKRRERLGLTTKRPPGPRPNSEQ
jgi:hypothetical protein